jgi:hypothetical protein
MAAVIDEKVTGGLDPQEQEHESSHQENLVESTWTVRFQDIFRDVADAEGQDETDPCSDQGAGQDGKEQSQVGLVVG